MHVDIGKVLHVLAHELRTPTGIAQGYVRMLLEERLADAGDRRRALEQTRNALSRMSELANESSQLANWMEADHSPAAFIDAGTLIEQAVSTAAIVPAPKVEVAPPAAAVRIATVDGQALVRAVTALVKATARELRTTVCTIQARSHENRMLDVLIGPGEHLDALAAGPDAANAQALALERGGLGLSLLTAAAVLQTHGASGWTTNGSRTTVGIRFPLEDRLEERAHQ